MEEEGRTGDSTFRVRKVLFIISLTITGLVFAAYILNAFFPEMLSPRRGCFVIETLGSL